MTVLLHAAKYPSCTVCGVLLGQTGSAGKVTVEAAIPLFHLSMLLSPCVETALNQASHTQRGDHGFGNQQGLPQVASEQEVVVAVHNLVIIFARCLTD